MDPFTFLSPEGNHFVVSAGSVKVRDISDMLEASSSLIFTISWAVARKVCPPGGELDAVVSTGKATWR